MNDALKKIENLREDLHKAIEEGDRDNILDRSKVLDEEIVKFINMCRAIKNKSESGMNWARSGKD